MSKVTEDTAPTGASTVHVTRTEGESPELAARMKQLAKTAEEHGIAGVFTRGASEGQTADQISDAMFTELRGRTKRGPQYGAPVALTEKEEQEYSVAKAILLADTGEKGFEREVSDEIAKRLPQGYKPAGTGLFVPTNLKMRVALEAGTSSLGGSAVVTEYGGMIDYLRNAAMVLRAGATMFPGLSAPVSFVKQTGTGTAYWVDETPGSDVTESNMTFGLVSLTPKTLQATQAFSRQVLVQARNVMNLESKVREDLVRLHALAIDAAALTGTGTLQPLGAVNNTNLGVVALGTHGAVPTYDNLVDQEVQVRTGNVTGPIATLTTPGIAGKLKKTQQFASTNGVPVWTGGLIEGTANGAPGFATNQVPSNLTKGTSTTICHAIITAAWRHLLIGEFGAAEIITDPFAKKKQGLIEVTSFQMIDMAIEYDAAFSVVKDARLA
jgi:HK97 family phage major capsid protein